MASPAPLRVCPQCARDNRNQPTLPYGDPPWEIKRCPACSFVYLENAPSYEQLQADFNWTDTKHTEKERRQGDEPRLMAFERVFRTWRKYLFGRRDKASEMLSEFVVSGRFLDVGCGNGRYFRRCSSSLSGYGIEIDPQAAVRAQSWAEATGGYVVHNDALAGMQQFPEDFFDGVLMRAYLEHEIEPRAVLESARRVLRPGGRIIIQVPNFASLNRLVRRRRWCGFRHPDHVNYFTPRTLVRMVQSVRLEIVQFRFHNHSPFSDRMWMAAEAPRTESKLAEAAPVGAVSG